MEFVKKLWHTMGQHKYLVTLIAFVLLLMFFDSNNVFVRLKYKHQLSDLQEQVEHYRALTDSLRLQLEAVDAGGKALETIARVQYGMHNDNEEVFIIEDKH